MSGRWACVTKSPLTGTVTDSHQGGWTGARLRWAGFDGLIFEGAADDAHLRATSRTATSRFHDAQDLWGKGIHETVKHPKQRHGDDGAAKDVSVCAIGPAGENLCRFAAWVNEDDRAFGRGGTAARRRGQEAQGHRHQGRPREEHRSPIPSAWKQVRPHGARPHPRRGQHHEPEEGRPLGLRHQRDHQHHQPHRRAGHANSQSTSFGDRAEASAARPWSRRSSPAIPTCHACPVACKKEVEVKEGPWKGLKMESVEYEPAWSLGSNCGTTTSARSRS